MLPLFTQGESYPLALFMALADGMQTVLARHQLDLAIFQSHSSEDELTQLKRIVSRRQVDGLIVSQHAPTRLPARLSRGTGLSLSRVRAQ